MNKSDYRKLEDRARRITDRITTELQNCGFRFEEVNPVELFTPQWCAGSLWAIHIESNEQFGIEVLDRLGTEQQSGLVKVYAGPDSAWPYTKFSPDEDHVDPIQSLIDYVIHHVQPSAVQESELPVPGLTGGIGV